MSFLGMETSIFGGKPIELYEFKRGSKAWRFSSSKSDVTYNGFVFNSTYVERDNMRSTGAAGRQPLNVTLAADNELAVTYLSGMPAQVTTLSVYRKHVGEAEVGQVWAGRVVNISFADDKATVKCEPISTTLRRIGLRATYQVLCRHALYGPDCKAVDNRLTGSVSSISGSQVIVSGIVLPPQAKFFAGGTMRSGDDAWLISDQSGSTMILAQAPVGLAVGAAVSLSAGCDHTAFGANGCPKFNNEDNFGGFPFMPQRNPFGNNPIV